MQGAILHKTSMTYKGDIKPLGVIYKKSSDIITLNGS